MPIGRRRVTAVAAAVTAVAVLAGCGGTTATQGKANAAHARNQVLSQIKALYQEFYGQHVGWAYDMQFNYYACAGSSTTMFQFYGFLDTLIAFNQEGTETRFRQDVLRIVGYERWKYSLDNKNVPPGGPWDANYRISKGPLKGDVAMSGNTGYLRIIGPCFDAGSAAHSLVTPSGGGGDITEPHPSPAPSPSLGI